MVEEKKKKLVLLLSSYDLVVVAFVPRCCRRLMFVAISVRVSWDCSPS